LLLFWDCMTEGGGCQEGAVLNFKMSHSMRNYGDETNDKDHSGI
jgi:hypothetical protein